MTAKRARGERVKIPPLPHPGEGCLPAAPAAQAGGEGPKEAVF